MKIIVFLLVSSCLLLAAWVLKFFVLSLAKQKQQAKSQLPQQRPPENLESLKQDTVLRSPTYPAGGELDRTPSVTDRTLDREQAFPIKKLQAELPNPQHQKYIRESQRVLYRLQSESSSMRLPKALGILRRMSPYAFEELLLTCCYQRGWAIERNFHYTNDGGIDGRVTIAGKTYVIQAKRYRGYINPKHIQAFYRDIQIEGAAGGFFIHTGITGSTSKGLIDRFHLNLLSGEKLVSFVLGQQLKIIGVTMCHSASTNKHSSPM